MGGVESTGSVTLLSTVEIVVFPSFELQEKQKRISNPDASFLIIQSFVKEKTFS